MISPFKLPSSFGISMGFRSCGWFLTVSHLIICLTSSSSSKPQDGLILSVFFDDQNGTESRLFTHFGFAPDGSNSPSKSWDAPHYIDVAKVGWKPPGATQKWWVGMGFEWDLSEILMGLDLNGIWMGFLIWSDWGHQWSPTCGDSMTSFPVDMPLASWWPSRWRGWWTVL